LGVRVPNITFTFNDSASYSYSFAVTATAGANSLTSATSNAVSSTIYTYPPAPLTANSTTLSSKAYGNGTYTVTETVVRFGQLGGMAFNSSSPYFWQVNPYPTTTTTTINTGTVYTGERVQILLPSAIVINGYTVGSNVGNAPSQWVLLGSNDGSTWYLVDSQTVNFGSYYAAVLFPVSPLPAAYKYFRFVYIASAGAYPAVNGIFFNSITKLS